MVGYEKQIKNFEATWQARQIMFLMQFKLSCNSFSQSWWGLQIKDRNEGKRRNLVFIKIRLTAGGESFYSIHKNNLQLSKYKKKFISRDYFMLIKNQSCRSFSPMTSTDSNCSRRSFSKEMKLSQLAQTHSMTFRWRGEGGEIDEMYRSEGIEVRYLDFGRFV